MIERKRHGRKLLIASIGVAAVSYVACGGSTSDNTGTGGGGGSATAGSGNAGTSSGGSVANTGGSTSTGGSANTGGQIAVGNLMAYPIDSGPDTSAIKDAAADKTVIGFEDVSSPT